MKYKTVTMGLKRDIRLERWNISQVSVQLHGRLEEGDSLRSAADEVYEDLTILLDEMEVKERLKFKEIKDAITTAHK